MPNSVEKLFDSILARLGPEPEDAKHKGPEGAELFDPVDEQTDLPEDGLRTLDEDDAVERNEGILAGRRSRGQVTPDEEEILEGGIRRIGFEALAFYKSRRFLGRAPFPEHWGIFYLKHGLQYVEMLIAREYPGYGNPRQFAHSFVREHERFHFRADLQTLMFEAATGRHLYAQLRKTFRSRRPNLSKRRSLIGRRGIGRSAGILGCESSHSIS